MSHWSQKYLGKEWSEDYDCYEFFRDVQTNVFGLSQQLDFVAPCYETRAEAIDFVDNSKDVQENWFDVSVAVEGDAVLFGNVHNSFHIGIWTIIDGQSGVLHCRKNDGVVFTPRKNLIESDTRISSLLRAKK
ncbi:hypothetical protein COB55_04875 [Candidatus Wolfebacteria bacterium]|nr:MAG: hypothetical protein COB55_04875 [Candidatus Wolfebacteria bacterium]